MPDPDNARSDPGPDEPDWPAYYRHTAGREPRPLFLRGMDAVASRGIAAGEAVEIGFGDGTETLALLDAGWRVTAVDPTPQAAAVLGGQVPDALTNRLRIVTASAADVELPPFDLVYAGYALSFIDPAAFPSLWAKVRAALRQGGIVIVNVFGVHDTWAGDPRMTFLDLERVRGLVDGLDVLVLEENEADGDSFDGPKHWHVFDVIATRPPGPDNAGEA